MRFTYCEVCSTELGALVVHTGPACGTGRSVFSTAAARYFNGSKSKDKIPPRSQTKEVLQWEQEQRRQNTAAKPD